MRHAETMPPHPPGVDAATIQAIVDKVSACLSPDGRFDLNGLQATFGGDAAMWGRKLAKYPPADWQSFAINYVNGYYTADRDEGSVSSICFHGIHPDITMP